MKPNFIPFYDRILVKPLEKSRETDMGLMRARDPQADRVLYGIVVAAGPGKPLDHHDNMIGEADHLPLSCKEGDTVWFGKLSAAEIKIDNITYYIMRESDAYGKEEN